MSIWVLHLPMSEAEEKAVTAREFLPVPLSGLPDLTLVTNASECKHLLSAMHPDEPPETLNRRAERVWRLRSQVVEEDIIAVPLPGKSELALAEVTGPYAYRLDEKGGDVHGYPVKWHEKRVPFRAYMRHKEVLTAGSEPMRELVQRELAAPIRDRLPHPWNRFVWIKWILVVFIGWRMINYLVNMYNTAPPM